MTFLINKIKLYEQEIRRREVLNNKYILGDKETSPYNLNLMFKMAFLKEKNGLF